MSQSCGVGFFLHSIALNLTAYFYLPCSLPIGHGRVDPILSYDCPSDHVHTFYGPQSGVDPRRIDVNDPLELHSRLVNTPVSENTGNVEENKSMYWHPTVYKYDKNTGTYKRDIMAQSSAYYVWDTGQTTAFPNGFQMISGFDIAKSQAIAECVNPQDCEGDCYTENNFFPSSKCDELEVSMRMPECWDGVSLSSPPSHTDHVAYAVDGDCPQSHPVKVPQIHLFFRIMPYDGGWHTFADDSGVFHADYVSGWDEGFLQNLLDNCNNEGDGAMPNFFCEDMLTYRDAPKCTDENTCDFGDPALLEKIKAFQPSPPLDIQGSIIAEETQTISALPRGTCNGGLVGGSTPTEAPVPTEPPQPAPTEAPVPAPTSAPVPSPTDPPQPEPTDAPEPEPEPEPEECIDDSDLQYMDVPWKNCEWVGRKYFKRCFFEWEGAGLWEYCPGACRECTCYDDDDLAYKRNPDQNCDWVAKDLDRCDSSWKGHTLEYFCPVTCEVCEYDIEG